MSDTWLDVLYYAALAANLAAAGLAWRGLRFWRWAGWSAGILSAALLAALAWRLGRPPLGGVWESMALQVLCLNLLALWPCGDAEADRCLRARVWLGAGLLLAVFLFLPRQLFPAWFNYDYIWCRLFFCLRNAGLACFLFAALAALASRDCGLGAAAGGRVLGWARNIILLGTAVFLAGEYCGFTWRLHWLGDYWSWNRNFLEATLVFLLATAALHLPPRWAASREGRTLALASPGLISVCLTVIHLISVRG
ncbi:MAG: hypothetical protein V1797_10880 [Pseudomonadota bacterium]